MCQVSFSLPPTLIANLSSTIPNQYIREIKCVQCIREMFPLEKWFQSRNASVREIECVQYIREMECVQDIREIFPFQKCFHSRNVSIREMFPFEKGDVCNTFETKRVENHFSNARGLSPPPVNPHRYSPICNPSFPTPNP